MDLQCPPGQTLSYEAIKQAIEQHKPKLLFLCQVGRGERLRERGGGERKKRGRARKEGKRERARREGKERFVGLLGSFERFP